MTAPAAQPATALTSAAVQPASAAPDPALARRQASWSRHWHGGALHSLETSVGPDLAGALGDFWRQTFAGLGPQHQVLDIATGNGSLPRLLMQHLGDQAPGCDAIDLARIEPEWLPKAPGPWRERLRFSGGVRAECLPFPQARFHLVVSQFGLEYADLAQAVPELLRVLAPEGRVGLVVHHRGSRLAEVATEELGHLDWLLQPEGLIDTTLLLAEPLQRSATAEGRASLAQDAQANAWRARFNALQDELGARQRAARHPDALQDARDAVARGMQLATREGAAAARHSLTAWREALQDHHLRLAELVQHALDEPGVQRLCTALAAAGGRTQHAPLIQQGLVLGWAVRLDRSNAA